MNTGFLHDPRFLEHDTGHGHPECAARLQATLRHLQAQPWFGALERIDAEAADTRWIREVHSADYLLRAERACRAGEPCLDTTDVAICPLSFDIALLAAGAALACGDAVALGRTDNAFALMRPPGHHAETAQALGFCLINNIAVLARYLQRQHGVDRILILDWDVHHGNGTQHTFYEDPSVLYVSTHQYPFYPGTGAAYETGTGRGSGATLNCPMPAGATDSAYMRAFMDEILPRVDWFKPEFVLLSAGFDAHRDDPLAEIALTTPMFSWMTERMLETADRHCGGRLVSLLEGGYDLDELPRSVAAHVATLAQAGSR
ncbi:MAG: histone deacetylase [Gammaproteobacteria bacterium]